MKNSSILEEKDLSSFE